VGRQAVSSLRSGKWERNKFTGVEVFGKTLGVVGVGNIGSVVADRAQGLKMKVVAYDPFSAIFYGLTPTAVASRAGALILKYAFLLLAALCIARAVGSLTAPNMRIVSSGTPSSSCLLSFE